MYIWSDEIIQFVQNSIDDFDEKMTFLIFQGGGHEKGEDLIEEGACSELTSFVCHLTQRSLNENKITENEVCLSKYLMNE